MAQTEFMGLKALLLHLRDGLENDTLSPRFVDKLLRKVRDEVNERATEAKEDVTYLETRVLLDEVAFSVIQKKASTLSSIMANLRTDE